MKSELKYFIAGAIAVALIGGIFALGKTEAPTGAVYNQNEFRTVATSSQMSIGTSSTQLIATSTDRIYLRITNTDANYVCLSFDADKPAVDCEGIYLGASGGSYEITSDNLYKGAIQAIGNTAASSLTITEAVR